MAEDLNDELNARLADRIAALKSRRDRTAQTRHELATRRAAGKDRLHHQRIEEAPMVTRPSGTAPRTTGKNHIGPVDPTKLVRCRYLRLDDEMCSGEVLDPTADVLLCAKHVGRVMVLIREAGGR